MTTASLRNDRPGIALVTVMLAALAVGAVSTAAALIMSNAWLIHDYDNRQSILEAVADAGLEEARARINGDDDLYPETGYAVLEAGVAVRDANNDPIPGVRRWTYAGPSGATTGQYGVFGSIVVVAEDEAGDRVVRRAEITQESFAKFAYFTDFEPSDIYFGGGDQLFGPVHSNSTIKIHETGATFHGEVTTAMTVYDPGHDGDFRRGYTEHANRIPMPELADLDKLRNLATSGNTFFDGDTNGGSSQASLRLEFVAIDIDGDGTEEGFVKAYSSTDTRWVTAARPDDYDDEGLERSRNCGHVHPDGEFVPAQEHPRRGNDNWIASITNHGRCYLGGSDSIWGGFVPNDGDGNWLPWPDPSTIHSDILSSGRADALYLFPLDRRYNPDFKGVIFVDGKVGISGVLRGHVTIAAEDDILIVDDLTYATDPGDPERNCQDGDTTNDDILGIFAGGNIVIADNTINTPTRPRANGNGNDYVSLDDTPEEIIHGTILTLNIFTVDNYDEDPDNAEDCGSQNWGRGCLFLTGGIIQQTRGAVGTSGGTGYLKRYSYDVCAYQSPPPYFPTTGLFSRGRSYEVDPNGFDIDRYFDLLTGGN